MVGSNTKAEKVDINLVGERELGGFRRELSFSGWYDDDGVLHSAQSDGKSSNVEEFDFQQQQLYQNRAENGVVSKQREGVSKFRPIMEADGATRKESIPHMGVNSDNYVPFDIENDSKDDQNPSSVGVSREFYANDGDRKSKSGVALSDVLKTLFFILVWYFFSTFLTLYNKTLLGDHLGKFPAPLLMNTFHFVMQAVLSKAIVWFWSERYQPTVVMSWKDYFLRVVPTSLATAMDVNLSNASLVFVSVTFVTMCKSASPIFLLVFAFAFRLESPSVKLFAIMLVISVGIMLTVAKETEFELWGFIFVMLAAVMAGFRWTMTQILLQKEVYGLKNPLFLMSYVTPVMALATALLSLMMDPWHEFKSSSYFDTPWHIVRSCLLMLFGGTLAFFMVLTEYILVSVTSAVTVTIAGVVKEAVTILVAVLYFHDKFTLLKGVGLFTIMFGVSLFNWYKYNKLKKGETNDEDGARESPKEKAAAKYVILEEMEDEDDFP